jgi:tubulysin polyketide synthase-like protein
VSTALDLLSECSAAGVELFMDNGRLRYRAQPGAYTDDLKRQVAACREELIAELAQQTAHVTPDLTREDRCQEALPPKVIPRAPQGPLPWHDATPDEGASLVAALFEGLPVQVYSKVLGEVVWWALDDDVARRLRDGGFVKQGYPPYQGEAIYIWSELLAVIGFSPDALKNLHELKKAFDAHVSRPPITCSACRNLAASYHHCLVRKDIRIANPDNPIECNSYRPR